MSNQYSLATKAVQFIIAYQIKSLDNDEGKEKQMMEIMKLTEENRRFYCVSQNMNSANSVHSQKKASQFENACIEFSNLEISVTFLFR